MAERTDDNAERKPVTPIDPEHPPLRVWLEVTRLSNLPTVFSNVLVGLVMGLHAWANSLQSYGLTVGVAADHILLWRLLVDGGWLLMIAAGCFYAAGMVLNDVCDAAYDREHRPHRPIPSGRLARRTAIIAVITFNLLGLLLVARFGLEATLLAIALLLASVGYNLLHRRSELAVVLMGVCRSLLYLLAAVSVTVIIEPLIVPETLEHYQFWFWRSTLPFAIILTLYVAAFTYLARRENDAIVGRRSLLAWGLPVLAIAGVLSVMPNTLVMAALTAAVGLTVLLWLGRCAQQVTAAPPQTKQAVMGWLAGLCLIDAYFLALMGRPAFVGAALVCFVATVLWQRKVMGT
ncbi:MAG: UbiA family prenyltransferase [Phycisphaeraceae bacterium]